MDLAKIEKTKITNSHFFCPYEQHFFRMVAFREKRLRISVFVTSSLLQWMTSQFLTLLGSQQSRDALAPRPRDCVFHSLRVTDLVQEPTKK